MSAGRGTGPMHLGSIKEYWGGINFCVAVQTETGTSSYQLFPGGAPFKCRVLRMRGIMTAAGGASDSFVLHDDDGNAITDTVNVSALSDTDTWEEAQINDARWDVAKGENLTLVTASDALAYVVVELLRVD